MKTNNSRGISDKEKTDGKVFCDACGAEKRSTANKVVMVTIEDFVSNLSIEEKATIIDNYEELSSKGVIGDCLLREKTKEFKDMNNVQHPIEIIMMNCIATEAFRQEYYRLKKINDRR